MKPVKLTPTQIRRFLALAFVSFEMGRDKRLTLDEKMETELLITKMIVPNGKIPHVTDRGQQEMARLCALGGITMPWNHKNLKNAS